MAIVKINALSVPPQAGGELEKRFAARAGTIEDQPGFLGFQLLRPSDDGGKYFVITQWEDEESFAAWSDSATGPGGGSHGAAEGETPRKPVSTGSEVLAFEVALDVKPRS